MCGAAVACPAPLPAALTDSGHAMRSSLGAPALSLVSALGMLLAIEGGEGLIPMHEAYLRQIHVPFTFAGRSIHLVGYHGKARVATAWRRLPNQIGQNHAVSLPAGRKAGSMLYFFLRSMSFCRNPSMAE